MFSRWKLKRWKLAQLLLQLAPESGAGIQREFPASVSWALGY